MHDKIIRLRKGKKGRLRPGHPWIFKGQILELDPAIKSGDIITVIDNENRFIGRGYYNPSSEISIRLLTFKDEPIDNAFIYKKIKDAVDKRSYLKDMTNAKRLIFSEADGLPGLIADLYNNTLVVQVFTLGMEKLKETVLSILMDVVDPEYVYEKSDSPFRKIEGLKAAKGWIGEAGQTNIEIYEGRAKFIVDIEKGHKTGFYLDQRRSRLALQAISKGKTVLDLFCYTGGFSINAALGGAKEAIGVDIKKEWTELARKNASLNGVAENTDFRDGDVFSILEKMLDSGERFDIIVLDPPSFAKDRKSIITATKGYKELNTLAMKTLNEGGVLCTFSCSHNMSNDIFSKIIKDSAMTAGKKFGIFKRCHQDKDHPFTKAIPETEYLKGYFLKATL
jgi:23S rRNA (cytosine1962-C5)-methyltransferase